jgi:hypothetical protein
LLQQSIILDFSASRGSGKQQIGQSPWWLPLGCINKRSSRNSAILFLHNFLCCGRWFFWQSTLQYCTSLQAHFFNLTSSIAVVPHDAQLSKASAAAACVLLIFLDLSKSSSL